MQVLWWEDPYQCLVSSAKLQENVVGGWKVIRPGGLDTGAEYSAVNVTVTNEHFANSD